MTKNIHYGNDMQIRGVEEYSVAEGTGRNMRIMHVRNGLGLEVVISPDRACDITRVTFKGDNMGYLNPAGYVNPEYVGDEALGKSFTAGFIRTCGLDNVGPEWQEEDVVYPGHGRLTNIPAKHCYWVEEENEFVVHGFVDQSLIGKEKLGIYREIHISKEENTIKLKDRVVNLGELEAGCMILYHINLGYPLLSENAKLELPTINIEGLDQKATDVIPTWQTIYPPDSSNVEVCFYHKFKEKGYAKLYNPDIKKGFELIYDNKNLPYFTQWKKLKKYDYVMALEPGNTHPIGRELAKKEGSLIMLSEGEEKKYELLMRFTENE